MWTMNTFRMVCITLVSMIISSNLHLHVIVREVDGKRIAGRYDIITLLHIGIYIYIDLITHTINI